MLPALVVDLAGAGRAYAFADSGQQRAASIMAAERSFLSASNTVDQLRAAGPPAAPIDELRRDLQVANAEFTVRDAVRSEQEMVFELAADPQLEASTLPHLATPGIPGLADATEGLRSMWRLAGVTDFSRMHPRRNRDFASSEPVNLLLDHYRSAAARVGIDWSYLAAINYIESDFGRTNGPSSAGALGPMQFLPATWPEYGGSGDIMSPADSIQAAAVFLERNGAPADYDRAILHYNRSQNYVAAVQHYAAAMRTDPHWLIRFYYWSTFG